MPYTVSIGVFAPRRQGVRLVGVLIFFRATLGVGSDAVMCWILGSAKRMTKHIGRASPKDAMNQE